MGWSVILQNENQERLKELSAEFVASFIDSNEYKLIKYLDPYGDTIFNNLQMEDLISDFESLKKRDANPLIDEIILLAIRCKKEIHEYLAFYGD